MKNDNKPLPEPSATTAPFWEAARQGRLELQYCGRCDRFQYYPRAVCANCWHENLQWKSCSGRGTVYSFSICHTAALPSFQGDVPYVVAMVELREGVRMTTNIIDCAPSDVFIGMEVEAVFEPVAEDRALVKFRPAAR